MTMTSSRCTFEVIIIGGGIAGASLAYFLARRGLCDVVLLEREAQPGYHATGRSAAVLLEFNRSAVIRRLMVDAAHFLRRPPPGFSDTPLLDPAGALLPSHGPMWDELQRLVPSMSSEGIDVRVLSSTEVIERADVLRPGLFDGGLLLPGDGHLDVHALLSGYLRGLTRAGGQLRCNVEVDRVLIERGRCVGIGSNTGEIRGRWVVNAAGAWVADIGGLAGAAPIPFTPRRRSAITFDPPPAAAADLRTWPMIDCESRRLYFKPESGQLLASPMDEDPVPAGDVRPTEEAIAITADRLARIAPRLTPRAIRNKWAGLRTFSPDGLPVVGPDPMVEGFFWLAGQGGVGIETSPSLGRFAAELILASYADPTEALTNVQADLGPSRFR